MKTKTKSLWKTTIGALILASFISGCKDENVGTVGVCPTVVSTIPANNATNVPLNQLIKATFNEPMNPATITQASFTLEGSTLVAVKKNNPATISRESTTLKGAKSVSENTNNPLVINKGAVASREATPVTGTISYSDSTATFTPSGLLTPNTTYTGKITSSVKDLKGNPLQVDYLWSFSTGASPTVISTDPADNTTSVSITKIVTAVFSVAMDPLTINDTTFTISQGTTIVAGTVSYSGTTATFTPSSPLSVNATYIGRFTTSVKDLMGNSLQTDYVWYFSTGTTLLATVISTDPANNATGVVLNKIVLATFNIPMDPLTITATTFIIKQGVTPVAGIVSYSGTTASFTPSINFSSGTIYTATITNGAKNIAGSPLANDYVWTFTTGNVIAPIVISTDPINNANCVILTKIINVTFSVPMDPLTLTTTTFTVKQGTTTVAGAISYTGSTASFTPSSALTTNAIYTCTINTGAKNAAGTPLMNKYVWTFAAGCVAIPAVISTDPTNNSTGVVSNKIVSAVFSVPMDPSTINAVTFTLKQGTTPVVGLVSYSGLTATFTPSNNLLSGTTYSATITTLAKSTLGASMATNYVWIFTTLTVSPPTVILTDPLDNATDVVLNKIVTATFSMTMDPLTLTSTTFTLKQGATLIAGTVSHTSTTVTFTPSNSLLLGTSYTATITTGAMNLSGIPMTTDYIWNFSTIAHLGPLVPDLKSVARFGIIAGVGVSNNAGPSVINNLDVGIYPGVRTSIIGFPPATVVGGAIYASDDIAPPGIPAMLLQAQTDLTAAYNFAAAATIPAPALAPADLGGKTLAPGIYYSTSTLLLQNGDLTLDAQGDENAVWIFQVASGFTSIGTAPYPSPSGGNVILAGNAQAKNVYWQVGSSAVIGDYTSFKGTILAFSSITMNSHATADGRMLARNAAVTMTSTNIINKP